MRAAGERERMSGLSRTLVRSSRRKGEKRLFEHAASTTCARRCHQRAPAHTEHAWRMSLLRCCLGVQPRLPLLRRGRRRCIAEAVPAHQEILQLCRGVLFSLACVSSAASRQGDPLPRSRIQERSGTHARSLGWGFNSFGKPCESLQERSPAALRGHQIFPVS